MLTINGYENKTLVGKIDEVAISEMEKFAQTDLLDIIDKSEYKKYYGVYSHKPEKFKFVVGHKQIITIVAEYFRIKEENDANSVFRNLKRVNASPRNSFSSSIKGNQKDNPRDNLNQTNQIAELNFADEKTKILASIKKWAEPKVNLVQTRRAAMPTWSSFQNDFDLN